MRVAALLGLMGVFTASVSAASSDVASAKAVVDSRLDVLFGAHQPYGQFLATLKTVAANRDWKALGDRVAYPIQIQLGRPGRKIRLKTPADFIAHAPAIMTPKVLNAIERQTYEALFANAEGVMIGHGELWFSGICSSTNCENAPVKITGIHP